MLHGIAAFDSEGMESWKRDSVRDVEIVSGCFLLIRRSLWNQLGGFDARFVMYGEDADLCIRARAAGARCVVDPGARVIHHAGASESDRGLQTVKVFAARMSLLRKHFGLIEVATGAVLLLVWAGSRFLAHSIARPFRKASVSASRRWSIVWKRRGEWLAGMNESLALGVGRGVRPDVAPRSTA
jgi:GT2 family glycosyltransferase